MSSLRRRVIATSIALGLVVSACSASDAEGGAGTTTTTEPTSTTAAGSLDHVVVPGAEWERAEPEEMGLDPEVLDEIAAGAEASGSNCLVVTRKGRIVGEWYWNGTDAGSAQEAFSATKSFTSTLVGIAQDQELLRIDQPASDVLHEWAGGPSDGVTIEDLLSNDSGREWSLKLDYRDLIVAEDKDRFAIELGQAHEPGTVWAYNNSAIQTLDAVLARSTGQPTAEFAREHLLEPIGMADSRLATDRSGNALMFMGLQSTCEDMARFGHLFLLDGRWGDEQVVSPEWVAAATTPSQELSSAYGYLWWLNRPGTLVDPTIATGGPSESGEAERGQMVDGAPQDLFWARGLGGQIVAVDPGSQTVAVRLTVPEAPEGAPSFGAADLAEVVTRALVEP